MESKGKAWGLSYQDEAPRSLRERAGAREAKALNRLGVALALR